MQFQLPESLEPSHGGVAQIHCRRTGTPQSLTRLDKIPEVVEVVDGGFADVVGKPGGQQALFQFGGRGNGDRFAVEGRAFSLLGDEQFIEAGIVNHAHHHLAPALVADRHAVTRIAVGVVHGAVDRIDHPQMIGVASRRAGLLGENRVTGKLFLDPADDFLFAQQVDFGNEVNFALVMDFTDVVGAFFLDAPRREGRLHRQLAGFAHSIQPPPMMQSSR